MSIGINLLFNLVENVARTLHDYDIEIIEMHHNQKKGCSIRDCDEISGKL